MLNEKQIRDIATRMELVTIEDMCHYSIPRLVVKIADKINELIHNMTSFESDVIANIEEQNEKLSELLSRGLYDDVIKIMGEWMLDGTLDQIINVTALKTVNDRIDNVDNSINTKLSNHLMVSVKDFGAKGDGVSDDTQAIEECLFHCIDNNLTCYFPNGHYMVTHGYLLSESSEDERANKHIQIIGESPKGVIIDHFGADNSIPYLFDCRFNKHIFIQNITSNMAYLMYNPDAYWGGDKEWRKSMRDKDIMLQNVFVHGDNPSEGYHLLIGTPAPDSYERFTHSNYVRYPININNNSGYNAINIHNFATNKQTGEIENPQDNSALGIVDAVNNSTGVIFIDMIGTRSFERYVSRQCSVSSEIREGTVWEVNQFGHLAIGCSTDVNDPVAEGWETVKLRDSSPSIAFIDANHNNSKAKIGVYHDEWGDHLYLKFADNNSGLTINKDDSGKITFDGMRWGGVNGGLKINQDGDKTEGGLWLDRNGTMNCLSLDSSGSLRIGTNATPSENSRIQTVNASDTWYRPQLSDHWKDVGYMHFDTDLGKPIWWDGAKWVDANGVNV